MNIEEEFKKNTTYREIGGVHYFRCKKGLWSASGGQKDFVEKEAKHYFIQYYKDGEYQ